MKGVVDGEGPAPTVPPPKSSGARPAVVELELSPDLALRLIAGDRCSTFTTGPGSCFRNGRHPLAKYGADRACDACIAWLALGGEQ